MIIFLGKHTADRNKSRLRSENLQKLRECRQFHKSIQKNKVK